MLLPQNIPINITPKNIRAISDFVESDYEVGSDYIFGSVTQ